MPVVKNVPANAEDLREVDLIPELGRHPGGGHGNPLQYSCLENPMDRGAWQATVHSVPKSQTWLKGLACTHKEWHTLFLFKCFRTSSEMPFSNYNPSFKNLFPQESLNKPVSNLLNKAHLGVIVYLILFFKVSRWDSHLQCKYQNDWKGLFRDTPKAVNSLTVSKFTK